MILSNVDIVAAMEAGDIVVEPLAGRDPGIRPFNTTTVDLRLGTWISVPRADIPATHRLDRAYDPDYIARNSEHETISASRPYMLERDRFVLARTMERIELPIREHRPIYAARVEGKSSRARLGMLVHFTAPTVHAGFEGSITLELINLGPNGIELVPGIFICQLVFEEVRGMLVMAPNQFKGQVSPSGER